MAADRRAASLSDFFKATRAEAAAPVAAHTSSIARLGPRDPPKGEWLLSFLRIALMDARFHLDDFGVVATFGASSWTDPMSLLLLLLEYCPGGAPSALGALAPPESLVSASLAATSRRVLSST